MSGSIKLEKGQYLFKENDPSDAMYVIKSGRLAITKAKQDSEIVLAELGPGAMLGEMAFFDDKPRSASAKAIKDTQLIKLPFKALHAQFKNFPEWSKDIMRTVNEHLRKANARIKELEKINREDEMFPPHTITQLVSVLNLVGHKYGKPEEEGLIVPPNRLRNYTIQIFQLPTHKMQKLQEALTEVGLMTSEKIGDGRVRLVNKKPELLFKFVEWYNDYLFKREEDRITVAEDDLPIIRAVMKLSENVEADDSGNVKLNLTEMQNESMRAMGYLVKVEDTNRLIAKGLMTDQMMEEDGVFSSFNREDLGAQIPFWELIYKLRKYTR